MNKALSGQPRELALALFDAGAFLDKRRSPEGKGFRLKLHEKDPNAPLSPFYLNLRTADNPKPGPLTAELVGRIGSAMYLLVEEKGVPYHAIAGIPRAGEPFANAFLAAIQGEPVPLHRFEKVEEGGMRRIGALTPPPLRKGNRLLLIDDLVTGADTKLEAVGSAQEAGFVVHNIAVLLDRQQGGSADLLQRGIHVWAAFTIGDLLWTYVEEQRIAHADYVECANYLGLDRPA